MLLSGYNEEERNQIIKEGWARYYNILEKVERGERPMYRPATWLTKERAIGKVRSSKNWYGVIKDTVLFVQAAPGEILKTEVQAVVKAHRLKVKVGDAGVGSVEIRKFHLVSTKNTSLVITFVS